MVVTSKERAISTVRSVEPSLTTMISSMRRLFVRTRQDLGDRLLFVIRRDDGRDPQ